MPIPPFTSLNQNLGIKFIKRENDREGFVVRLQKVIAYNGSLEKHKFSLIRIDEDGGSYALNVSIRVKVPAVAKYMVVYFFEEKYDIPIFRAVAEKIDISYFDDAETSIWPT